jgi:N-acetylmuramoyl-L-alanine amidase
MTNTTKQKVVCLTAGHSAKDSGAVSKDGSKEADLAVMFRNAVLTYLQKHTEIHTRVDGYGVTNLPLTEAIKLIKGSQIALEIHCNASTNTSAGGTETIALPKDKLLAQKLSKAVADVLGTKLRGDKGYSTQEQSQHSRLGYVANGGLILELMFISNPTELQTFKDKYWLVAKAVYLVICEHLGIKPLV